MRILQNPIPSPGSDRKPPWRRRFWPLGIGLAASIALFAVFAPRQGSGEGGGGLLNAIAEAAVKTQQAGGGRAVMRGTIIKPGQTKPLVLSGRVVYSAAGLSRGTVSVFDPESNDSVRVKMVQDGTEIYMRSSRFGTLPEGREWMGLDLALGDDFDAAPPASVDARGELGWLEQVSGGVQKVGKEKVHGLSTTHYRGRISVSESAERLREKGLDDTASLVEKKGAPMGVEAWIDTNGLVRRMRLVQSKPGEQGEGPTTTDMHVDFLDFGLEPEIEVPDSSEVFDATSLVQEQVHTPSDE